jgi:hypothetical protein
MELLYCCAARESKTLVLLEKSATRLLVDNTSALTALALIIAATLNTTTNLCLVVRINAHVPH